MATKQKYKSFSKPFYKLLGVSVISLAIIYGGIVWAFNMSGAQHCFHNPTHCVGVAPVGKEFSSALSGGLQSGKTLRVTNTGNYAQFVPLKTATERNSLLSVRNTGANPRLNELQICEPGTSKSDTSVFGHGIYGCDDAQCIATVTNVQKCSTKAGVIGKKKVFNKKWIDGSAFNWSGTNLNGVGKWSVLDGPSNYLYRGKSTTIGDGSNQRDNCGPANGHNHGAKMYRPDGDNKWRKYWCSKKNCFGGCDYRWKPAYEFNPVASATWDIENESVPTGSHGYNVTCTKVQYKYSGTYTESDCSEGNGPGDNQLLFNPLNIFAPKAMANELDDECNTITRSCSDYNYWAEPGRSHGWAPDGCSPAGTAGSMQDICYRSCGARTNATCTGDSNCQLADTSSTVTTFNEYCGYSWSDAPWSACELSGYGTSRVVRRTRYSRCQTTTSDGTVHNVANNNCVEALRPSSWELCGSSHPKYYFQQDSHYSGCTATCDTLGGFSQNQNEFNPLDVFATANANSRLMAPACSGNTTAYGTEYKESKCYKVVGDTNTNVSKSQCNNAGLSTPHRPSRQCSRSCPCTDGPGGGGVWE